VIKEEWQKKGAGHRARLRDKFLEKGLDGFTDAEILELLLSFGTPRTDCKIPAREALKRFGSLASVLEASPDELQEIRGIGKKNSFALGFIQQVSRRYLQKRIIGKHYLHSSKEVREYLLHSMQSLDREILSVIFLDSSHAIVHSEVVAEGTVNVNTVYPREIVKRALFYNAAALILAHNHPSGSLKPSPQDVRLTRELILLCSMMNISLLDHFIIGDGTYSFADEGRMELLRNQAKSMLNQQPAY